MSDASVPQQGTDAAALPTGGLLGLLLKPTLTRQCWGFMIGSLLFALSSAPGLSDWLGSGTGNVLCFIGAWGFTYAGFIQWITSGPRLVSKGDAMLISAVWLAAATQSVGTVLFNVSTSAALTAKSVAAQEQLVWNPDAAGSVAFLISGALAIRGYRHRYRAWNPGSRDWWSTQINMVGCIAFGVSAVGAYILSDGSSYDPWLANAGTFVGAVCFFLASLIVLPSLRPSSEG
jgi:uncharacterized membrane protein